MFEFQRPVHVSLSFILITICMLKLEEKIYVDGRIFRSGEIIIEHAKETCRNIASC